MKLTGLWQSISGSTLVFAASTRFAELFRPQSSVITPVIRAPSLDDGSRAGERIKRNSLGPDAAFTRRGRLVRLSSRKLGGKRNSDELLNP